MSPVLEGTLHQPLVVCVMWSGYTFSSFLLSVFLALCYLIGLIDLGLSLAHSHQTSVELLPLYTLCFIFKRIRTQCAVLFICIHLALVRGRQRLPSTKRHVSLIEEVKIMAAFYLIHVLNSVSIIIITGGTLNGYTDYMKSMACVPKHTTLSVICLLTILTIL